MTKRPPTDDKGQTAAGAQESAPAHSSMPEPGAAVTVQLRPMPAPVVGAPPESGIGDRLRYARSQLVLSTEGLARLTRSYDRHEARGISGTSIARYESGASLPAARELRLLCQALDVPPAWLLLGEVPNGGRTAAAQALFAALAGFIHEVGEDVAMGGERASAFLERSEREVRARWLASARKPESSTSESSNSQNFNESDLRN